MQTTFDVAHGHLEAAPHPVQALRNVPPCASSVLVEVAHELAPRDLRQPATEHAVGQQLADPPVIASLTLSIWRNR